MILGPIKQEVTNILNYLGGKTHTRMVEVKIEAHRNIYLNEVPISVRIWAKL